MDFTGILVQLAYVAIFVGIAYFAVDQYRLWRERRVEAWRKDGHLPKPKGAAESGTNGKGELSTAAKYAIWNYMFSLFAVGGTIIGIVSGIAGYMIKDLATERAIQTALNKMQEPLSSQLDKFADANAALKVAAERINDSKTFPNAVADDLVARYPEKLRGERGADGKNGVDGKDGKDGLPGKDGKDGLPGKDGPGVADVVATLMQSHAAALRGKDGSNGKDGVNGKDGKDGSPGKDGPSAAEVAAVLMRSYAAELRGKDGSNGKDGVNGKDGKDGLPGKDGSSVAEVTAALMMSHVAELRGKDGSTGRDGTNGKDGVNGTNGVSPDLGEIAELVVKRYRDQLRGLPGKDGTNGSNGQSPKPAEVAAALWDGHREEISRHRESRKRSR